MKIEEANGKLRVSFPYYPPTVKALKERFGAKWNPESKTWSLDARDRTRLEQLLREDFGTAGEAVPLCTIQVPLYEWEDGDTIWIVGRRIAHRPGRDHRVTLGEGVIITQGGFPSTGGSMNHPRLDCRKETVAEIRDVPISLATRLVEKYPEITILEPVPIPTKAQELKSLFDAMTEQDQKAFLFLLKGEV